MLHSNSASLDAELEHRDWPPAAVRVGAGICSTTARPIGIDAVAAGDGALHTCMLSRPGTIRKSSTIFPSGISACARTPAWRGNEVVLLHFGDQPLKRLR